MGVHTMTPFPLTQARQPKNFVCIITKVCTGIYHCILNTCIILYHPQKPYLCKPNGKSYEILQFLQIAIIEKILWIIYLIKLLGI